MKSNGIGSGSSRERYDPTGHRCPKEKKGGWDGVGTREERCSLNRSSFFCRCFVRLPSTVHCAVGRSNMAAVELSGSWFSAALFSSHSLVPFVWFVKSKKTTKIKQIKVAKPGFHNPWTLLSCQFLLLKGTKDMTVSPCSQ